MLAGDVVELINHLLDSNQPKFQDDLSSLSQLDHLAAVRKSWVQLIAHVTDSETEANRSGLSQVLATVVAAAAVDSLVNAVKSFGAKLVEGRACFAQYSV